MAQFFQDLWESIFTPGPTPSLLLATNATFACLQLVLFGLLLATHSVHLVVLSFLCGGLWWSINWFARELKAAQQREAQDKAAEEERVRKQQRRAAAVAAAATPVSTDSETEVETTATAGGGRRGVSGGVEPLEKRGELKQRSAGAGAGVVTAAAASGTPAAETATAPVGGRPKAAEARAVPGTTHLTVSPATASSSPSNSQPLSGSRSGVSTEDEWEKVSENEKDK